MIRRGVRNTMKNDFFLGIDTSNYTTSLAICDTNGKVHLNHKIPLPVREGERGLRQSDAVFHHVRNLSESATVMGEFFRNHPDSSLLAVGCSVSPRDVEGSYMPCFLSGVASAEFVAQSNDIPLYRFSHQAGHVMAALYSACGEDREKILSMRSEPFLAFHVSGGTTDLLLCTPNDTKIFDIEQIGGSRDINGGQALDRTGVRMGLPFPCGRYMDEAALEYNERIAVGKLSVNGTWCNLSGLENKAEELYKTTGDVKKTSAYTLSFIAATLEKMTLGAFELYGKLPVLYAGGVMSSKFIRNKLQKYGMFADAAFSSDNAAGTVLLTAETFRKSEI